MNALRHASAQQVLVKLRYRPTTLEVTVTDDGRGPSRLDGGHGLVGIREPVALYGGTVEFAPAPGSGSRLAATLPVREDR